MSPPSSTAAVKPAASRRGAGWVRRVARLVVAAALLGTLFWAGWYVYNRGFTRKWREQLAAELRRRGFDFTAAKLTLNPFEGLVAEDADLYLLDAHHTHLLNSNRIAVDIDVRRLIQGKPFLNALDLRDTRLSLPVDMADPDGPTLKVRHLNAKVALLPGEVRVTQAQGDFYGLQISLSGSLLHPESYRPAGTPAAPDERDRRRQWARTITSEIEKVHADRVPPSLEIRFQGDLARLETLRASAQLQGDALQRGSYRLDHLLLRLDYAAGAFHLRQGELRDRRGTLALMGDFNPANGEARFQAQSGGINRAGADSRTPPSTGLDLLALAREFADPGLLSDWTLRDTPRLQVDGRWRFGPPPAALPPDSAPPAPGASALQITGRLALGRFAYHVGNPDRTFEFERGETDFSWNGDRWYLRDLRLVRPGGNGQQQLSADVLSEPGQARVRLTSTFDPTAFASFLPAKGREAIARLEFRDPPRLDLAATGRSLGDFASLKMEGQLTLGRTRYRGVGINRLHGEWTLADGLLSGRHLLLERDEGVATGDLVTYQFDKHEVRLENVRTSLDPGQAGVWLDPDVYHTIQPFRFRKPPALSIHGNIQFFGGRNSHLVTEVSAPGGMDYVFLKKNLPFQSIAGQVVFTEERLWLNEVHGEIFGGEAKGALNLALGRIKDYTASLELKGLDFVRLTKLYFDYENSKGQLSGAYRFTGTSDDARTLHGAGTLNVERGNVFSIPFMGPLSTILGTVVPGLGYDEAHQASADFLTSGGKIYTGNLNVKGLGFGLFGGGWLGYMDDTMNFRIRMNARGLPGAVLRPVSNLFEYRSQGPLAKPVWRPNVLTAPLGGAEKKPATAPTPAKPR